MEADMTGENETGAEEPVVEPSMEEVAEQKEPENKPVEAATTEGDSPSPVDVKEDHANEAVQKRINKITAEKYAEQRRADELQAKLDAKENKPALPADAPKLEDYDYDEAKHQEALIDYRVQKALENRSQVESQNQAKLARQETATKFASEEAKYAAEHPDYVEDVNNLPKFNGETLNSIYELGPQVTHYLAKNLDTAFEIANATPLQAAVKLGQISAVLTGDKKEVKPSNAPEPVKTIVGGATVSKDMDDMSMDEIMAL